jgi:molybdopterin-containing oxidoreductase family iron-sulfur binding subunit
MVLELYDSTRVKHAGKINDDTTVDQMDWEALDATIQNALSAGSNIRILTPSNYSPSFAEAVKAFKAKYPNTEVVTYDAHSNSAMLLANQNQFGTKGIPSYHFDKAEVIVNFNADFLGTWIAPVQFAHQWAKNRKIKDAHHAHMSRMIAFESHMTLTGSNADSRVVIRPSELGLSIAKVHNEVAKAMGGTQVSVSGNLSDKGEAAVKAAAKDLIEAARAGKHTLVVSGSNNTAEQMLVNNLNMMLGNYGHSIDWNRQIHTSQTVDKDIDTLYDELKASQIDALFVMNGANPVYSHAKGQEWADLIKNVKLSVNMSYLPDETFVNCQFAAPVHHGLESWGDAEPVSGYYSLIQPTIAPLFDTRQAEASLLTWGEHAMTKESSEDDLSYRFVKANWEQMIFPKQSDFMSFRSFWDSSLHDGFVMVDQSNEGSFTANLSGAGSRISKASNAAVQLAVFETVNLGAGQYANNPWLQEMPDPLVRTVWDNCLTIPVQWDGGNSIDGWKGLENGDLVELKAGDRNISVTVVQQFGQKEGTVSLALGYGRSVCGRAGASVGHNIYPSLMKDEDGNVQYYLDAEVSDKVGVDDTFASVQYHHTFGVKDEDPETGETINVDEKTLVTLSEGFQGSLVKRSIIRHADLSQLEDAVHDLEHEREHHQHLNEQTLYPGFSELYDQGHKWEMSIDLSACIGCGACQVACVSENNVPVVGKNEVRRHHEMTWLRIDRYFYGDFENPNTVYQPMMCQHCDNAPCENVCPVSATNHSSEGLNQMTYNRCIGTRYCANNCPYKVRRFNWLDYTTADMFGINENHPMGSDNEPFYADNLTRMVLNPDVTVRSRGVIEKCSFCVQRIQEGKLRAKTEMRALQSSDVVTACASACPTGAITFGDVNDKSSEVYANKENPLNYYVLEEVNTQSSVGYHMKVVNRNAEISEIEA